MLDLNYLDWVEIYGMSVAPFFVAYAALFITYKLAITVSGQADLNGFSWPTHKRAIVCSLIIFALLVCLYVNFYAEGRLLFIYSIIGRPTPSGAPSLTMHLIVMAATTIILSLASIHDYDVKHKSQQ